MSDTEFNTQKGVLCHLKSLRPTYRGGGTLGKKPAVVKYTLLWVKMCLTNTAP